MEKFLVLLKENPKKALVFVIALLAFTVASIFLDGCAYKFHVDKADNLSHSIEVKR